MLAKNNYSLILYRLNTTIQMKNMNMDKINNKKKEQDRIKGRRPTR